MVVAAGPGKYDDLLTYVRETALARGALLFVCDGVAGTGFGMQGDINTQLRMVRGLRATLDEIERELEKLKP